MRREARGRYRRTERGRETGRKRQRRYRVRQADLARAAVLETAAGIPPGDVPEACAFLLSGRAGFITGTSLSADGGLLNKGTFG